MSVDKHIKITNQPVKKADFVLRLSVKTNRLVISDNQSERNQEVLANTVRMSYQTCFYR